MSEPDGIEVEVERIRQECAETRRSSWWGEYPVHDVELLLLRIAQIEAALADAYEALERQGE